MMLLFSAVAAVLAGVGLIRSVWRRQSAYRSAALWTGWALLGLSCYLWTLSEGTEFGIVFGLGVASVAAWAVTAANTEVKTRKRTDEPDRESPRLPPVRVLGRQLAVFLLVMLVAAIASLLGTMGLSRLFPIGEIDRMAFVIIALPIVWGTLAYVVCASPRVDRPLVLLTLVGAGGFGLMMV